MHLQQKGALNSINSMRDERGCVYTGGCERQTTVFGIEPNITRGTMKVVLFRSSPLSVRAQVHSVATDGDVRHTYIQAGRSSSTSIAPAISYV